MKSRKPELFLWLLLPFCLSAQMPDTEVWLFEVKKDKKGVHTLHEPVNVSNRKGYDNQPSFSVDSKQLYYTSDANGQADIYAYQLKTKKALRISTTEESEYSPRATNTSGKLAAVVVEKDSAQRLHFLGATTGKSESRLDTDS